MPGLLRVKRAAVRTAPVVHSADVAAHATANGLNWVFGVGRDL